MNRIFATVAYLNIYSPLDSLDGISPYFTNVLSIDSTSAGPSFLRTNFPIEITSRISPLCSHTAFPIISAIFSRQYFGRYI